MDDSHWYGLAHHLVIKVFSYVSQNDRFNLSLVCKEWSDVFHDSELWKRFVFKFDEEVDKDGRALVCAERYGDQLKDVELLVNQTQRVSIKRALGVLDGLIALDVWMITRFKFGFLGRNPLFFDGNAIIDKLKKFLLSVKDKKSVFELNVIDLSRLSIALDNDLLNIFANHHKYLRVVHIQNECLVDKITEKGVINLVKSCAMIEEFYAFYHCINDDVIGIFSENSRSRLVLLSLKCNRSDKFNSYVSSDAWEGLTRASPDIELKMLFDSTMPRHMVIPILCSKIPATAVDLHLFAWIHEETHHIANVCRNTLKFFSCHTSVDPYSTANAELPPALLDLVSSCNKLEELHVHCNLPDTTINSIKTMRTLKNSTLYSHASDRYLNS